MIFVDRSVGSASVAVLEGARFNVKRHDSLFDPATPDVEWLGVVGKRGWPVLTRDSRIRRRPDERAAYLEARIPVFVLSSGNLPGDLEAEAVKKAIPAIHRALAKHKPPFMAGIDRHGKVTLIETSTERN